MKKVAIEDNKNINSEIIFKEITFRPYLISYLFYDLIIIIGSILKYIYPLKSKDITKTSYLTGIPLFRYNFFLFPFIITFICFFLIIIIYYFKNKIKEEYNSLINFFQTINLGYIITNLFIFGYFFLIYTFVIQFIYKYLDFKISGHTFASLLSGEMLVNMMYIFLFFHKNKIYQLINKILIFVSIFLIIHNGYTLLWTSWVFHPIPELVSSFFLSVISLFLIHYFEFDKLIIKLCKKYNNQDIIVNNFNIVQDIQEGKV